MFRQQPTVDGATGLTVIDPGIVLPGGVIGRVRIYNHDTTTSQISIQAWRPVDDKHFTLVCANTVSMAPGHNDAAIPGCYASSGDVLGWFTNGKGLISVDNAGCDASCDLPGAAPGCNGCSGCNAKYKGVLWTRWPGVATPVGKTVEIVGCGVRKYSIQVDVCWSAGASFVALVLVVGASYFGIGVAVMHQRGARTWPALVPHHDHWLSLLGLVRSPLMTLVTLWS